MQKAIGYLRRSTRGQDLSFNAQERAVRLEAAAEGFEVVAFFRDTASGSTAPHERPGFVAALSALKEHKATALVVAKRDRLARDVMHSAMADATIRKMGARILSQDAPKGDDPYTRAMVGMLDVFAELERNVIRIRTKAALDSKRAKGEYVGRAPYGWRHDGKQSGLVEVPDEQAELVRIARFRRAGYSWRAIGDEIGCHARTAQRRHESFASAAKL